MLTVIRILHTLVWAVFAGAILALPVLGCVGRFDLAAIAIGAVLVEGMILLVNRWRCPLTDLAARHVPPEEQHDAFDIYLPRWLARHNKTIFTILFALGVAVVIVCWLRGR